MNKKILVICSSIAVLGGMAYWGQQSPSQSVNKIVVSDTAEKQIPKKQTPSAVSLSNKVDVVEPAIIDDSDSNETFSEGNETLTLEEAGEIARRAHFVSSGLAEIHRQSNLKLERHNQRVQAYNANQSGFNERTKNYLKIDTVKHFNIDMDAEIEKMKAKGQAQQAALFDKNLVAQGVGPEGLKELALVRTQLMGLAPTTTIDE